ncbi:Excinuclease ABC C subunit domain-containing protein [Nitritalea halalkaliphila LW7]|uniref:Excinuclease ABC C subunit domain-containing protein n=2 Tax=Nitritalea TaxID=1187887 RepID=I5BUU7_9BACT|nr:Excinuclease ABC C subunit domain-containing protein [Nitritalea halalkaliphila LW7]
MLILTIITFFSPMFTVYALYSQKFDKLYIGFTANLEQRLLSHNVLGKKGWSIKFRPWTVLHIETFETKSEAMKREKELKSGKGRQFLRALLNTQ